MKLQIKCVTPPTSEQLERIEKYFLKKYNADSSETSVVIDPSVGAGFILTVDNDEYDWTQAGRLNKLEESLRRLPFEGDVNKVIPLIKEGIENFDPSGYARHVGRVVSVNSGIVFVTGLNDAAYGEIVVFDSGVKGMVQEIRKDSIGVILFGRDTEVETGMKVTRSFKTAGLPVSDELLGRVISPLGIPLDEKGPIPATHYNPIEWAAPSIMDREGVHQPMETGILTIDALFPIGRGQRELIIGDRQTGKTTIAIDAIMNQKGKNMVCVYVAIGQKASSVASVYKSLEAKGALDYTVIVNAPANDAATLQFIAPYAGCAVAEYFMYKGKDVLIVYDDLSKHAVAYRTLSLLLERSPGREAYPGDIFYLHSRLLERAACLNSEKGGGSITALPIVETQAGDISSYIPTNIISITDGQLFLDSDRFAAGQRPAINVGISVSRVGGAAQTKAMKKVAGSLRLDLAQYREMEVFTRFSSDMDESTKARLEFGSRVTRLLVQANGYSLSMRNQIILLVLSSNHWFDSIPLDDVITVRDEVLAYLDEDKVSFDPATVLTQQQIDKILSAADEYKQCRT